MNSGGKFDRKEEGFFDKAEENKKPDLEKKPELPIKIILQTPITIGETCYTDLFIKKFPTAYDTAHLPVLPDNVKRGHYIPITASMCGVPEVVIEQLTSKDFRELLNVVTDFL